MNPRDLKSIVVVAAILCIGLSGEGVRAVSAQAAQAAAKTEIPLKVTIVIARFTGEKKTASLPFTLTVITNERTSLRMGSEVPIPSGSAQTAYTYRSVGTNIDCGANVREDGRFRLVLTITDSQIFSDQKPGPGVMSGIPSFQSFTSNTTLMLADGQSTQFTTATDKVSGEVVRVDVTVNVVK
jgi:Flp pilus assembly secretin CpaC